MSVSKKEVEYIADLAKLQLTEKELQDYTAQLNKILEYVEKLNEVDTEHIKPLSHPIENYNVFREDEPKTSIDRSEALKNAPSKTDEFFKMPKVISSD